MRTRVACCSLARGLGEATGMARLTGSLSLPGRAATTSELQITHSHREPPISWPVLATAASSAESVPADASSGAWVPVPSRPASSRVGAVTIEHRHRTFAPSRRWIESAEASRFVADLVAGIEVKAKSAAAHRAGAVPETLVRGGHLGCGRERQIRQPRLRPVLSPRAASLREFTRLRGLWRVRPSVAFALVRCSHALPDRQ
jgi:hypothetical protein